MNYSKIKYSSLVPGYQIKLYDQWTMITCVVIRSDLSIAIYTENGIIDLPSSKRHEKINVRY